MIDTAVSIIIFFFGAIIGSFLNVVILRYRSGRTLGGRSMCFTCGKKLHWSELVPIGSFLTQRGRCQGCRAPISWQYPAVEILTGFLFVFLYFRYAFLLPASPGLFAAFFFYGAVLISLLVILSVYDLRHKILPDPLVFAFAAIALVGLFFVRSDMIVPHLPRISEILAGLILPLPFSLLWVISKGKWMGLGDAKLMIGIGFLLGMSGGLMALLLSFWIGAAFSIILLLLAPLFGSRAVSLKTAIPFGPFLALGTLIVFLGNIDLGTFANLFVR